MAWKVPLSDIDFGEGEIGKVTDVLKSKWLSMGPLTLDFEKKFAKYMGVKHAFMVSNCTAALHLAHKVIGIGHGDEVITPSLTFVATANSILYCDGTPVFADIKGTDNLNISPDEIKKNVTPRTKAITIVHYAGYPCDMKEIMEIANENDLRVIEDAAHAPGARYKNKIVGSLGDLSCFSFFSNKNLVTGEGGMIVTDNNDYAEKIRYLRSHGMTTLTWDRHKGHAKTYDVVDLGFNYRSNEITATLGLCQLKKLDRNNKRRGNIVDMYRRGLSKFDEFTIPFANHEEKPAYHIFPTVLSDDINREELIQHLKNDRIQSSVHYPPIHLFSFYKKKFETCNGMLPKTELIGKKELTLPLHPLMKREDVNYVLNSIGKFLGE